MPPTKFSEIKNSAELYQKLALNENIFIVKFTATWCGPCKRIESFVNSKLDELPESVHYYELDIDDNIEIYGFLKTKKMVNGIPALLCWAKGNQNFAPDYLVVGAVESEVQKFFDACKSKIEI